MSDDREPLEPVPFEARVCVWCWLLMASIIAVSILAGWLWPLEQPGV